MSLTDREVDEVKLSDSRAGDWTLIMDTIKVQQMLCYNTLELRVDILQSKNRLSNAISKNDNNTNPSNHGIYHALTVTSSPVLSELKPTRAVCPEATSPRMILSASRLPISFAIKRLRGRAPYLGS